MDEDGIKEGDPTNEELSANVVETKVGGAPEDPKEEDLSPAVPAAASSTLNASTDDGSVAAPSVRYSIPDSPSSPQAAQGGPAPADLERHSSGALLLRRSVSSSNHRSEEQDLPRYMRSKQAPEPAVVHSRSPLGVARGGPPARPTRRLTLYELTELETEKRSSLLKEEHKDRQHLEHRRAAGAQEVERTAAWRAEYLASEEFQKVKDAGQRKKKTVDENEEAKRKREAESATFHPTVSSAAAARPSRSLSDFVKDSEEWIKKRAKSERATSATREAARSEQTFMTKKSLELVKKLAMENKHVGIVEGWEKRMEEHKKRMLQLDQRYTPTFKPSINTPPSAAAAAAPAEGGGGASAGVPPPVTRLYDTALEQRKKREEKLQAIRNATVAPSLKRNEQEIREHFEKMLQKAKESERQFKHKRDKIVKEEQALEHNNFKPQVNKRSAVLAEKFRNEKLALVKAAAASTTDRTTTTSTTGDGDAIAAGASDDHQQAPNAPHTDVPAESPSPCRPSAAATTTSSSSAGPAGLITQHLPPNIPISLLLNTRCVQSRFTKDSAPAHETHVKTAPARSAEFQLRYERMLQHKKQKVEDWQKGKEEEERKLCTFAPQISATSKKLVEKANEEGHRPSYRDPTTSQSIREGSLELHSTAHHHASSSLSRPSAGSISNTNIRAGSTSTSAVMNSSPVAEAPSSSGGGDGDGHLSDGNLASRLLEMENMINHWKQMEEQSRM
jgi:hypothetical protein